VLTRDEQRRAGAILLAGIGAGVVQTEEVTAANASDYPAYAIGRLTGQVSGRLRDRAVAEIREALDLVVGAGASCDPTTANARGPQSWLLQGEERVLSVERAASLPSRLVECVQLSLGLIDRLMLPFLWPVDLAQAWMIEELTTEWAELVELSGSNDCEAVAAWFADEGQAQGIETYHFDAGSVEGCEWAARMSALRVPPVADSPLACLYSMNRRVSPWLSLARLESLTGTADATDAAHEAARAWCALVAQAARWHTGGQRGARELRRLERRCGCSENSDEYTDGVVPLCEGTVVILGREGEIDLVQQTYQHRMEAGETACAVMRFDDALGGGSVLHHRLRGALLGGALLDRLGTLLEGNEAGDNAEACLPTER